MRISDWSSDVCSSDLIGTWWIPMLVVLGVWRYLIQAVPFAYDPLYWGGVFPLGMYSVCTYRLAEVLPAPFLMPLSKAFMLIALAAWAMALFGLLDSLLVSRPAPTPAAGLAAKTGSDHV